MFKIFHLFSFSFYFRLLQQVKQEPVNRFHHPARALRSSNRNPSLSVKVPVVHVISSPTNSVSGSQPSILPANSTSRNPKRSRRTKAMTWNRRSPDAEFASDPARPQIRNAVVTGFPVSLEVWKNGSACSSMFSVKDL